MNHEIEGTEKQMNITTHRAANRQGEIIEICTAQTKILLDSGANLEENEVLLLADLQADYQFAGINAVFLTHCRTDYPTLAREFLPDVPVYGAKLTGKVCAAVQTYKAKTPTALAGCYASGTAITVGDITVTPYAVDDAIFDRYLLVIEGDGKRILYAGDYCANSRKSFAEMLAGLPSQVDLLVCECGVITADDTSLITEHDLEEQAATLFAAKKGPVFVLHCVTDFDRAATMLHAAKRTKRLLLEDLYLAQIANSTGKAMPNPAGWAGVRAYLTTGYREEHPRYKLFTAQPRLSKTEIAAQKFVMFLRTPMKKYLKTLDQCMRFQDGVIINALPDTARKSAATQEFLAFAASKGLEVISMRTSGHADAMALKALVEATSPAKLLPLNPQHSVWLAAEYPKTTVLTGDTAAC